MEKTVFVAQEGQITERFTRAVEQLGSEKMEIRLGGIYALERIARDSEKDHWTVMEVLSAFVRENAPLGDKLDADDDEEKIKEERKNAKMATDIQAALTVIGRRKYVEIEVYENIDISDCDLRKAELKQADLQGAILQKTKELMKRINNSAISDEYTKLPEFLKTENKSKPDEKKDEKQNNKKK
jgi:hypothetical protein